MQPDDVFFFLSPSFCCQAKYRSLLEEGLIPDRGVRAEGSNYLKKLGKLANFYYTNTTMTRIRVALKLPVTFNYNS